MSAGSFNFCRASVLQASHLHPRTDTPAASSCPQPTDNALSNAAASSSRHLARSATTEHCPAAEQRQCVSDLPILCAPAGPQEATQPDGGRAAASVATSNAAAPEQSEASLTLDGGPATNAQDASTFPDTTAASSRTSSQSTSIAQALPGSDAPMQHTRVDQSRSPELASISSMPEGQPSVWRPDEGPAEDASTAHGSLEAIGSDSRRPVHANGQACGQQHCLDNANAAIAADVSCASNAVFPTAEQNSQGRPEPDTPATIRAARDGILAAATRQDADQAGKDTDISDQQLFKGIRHEDTAIVHIFWKPERWSKWFLGWDLSQFSPRSSKKRCLQAALFVYQLGCLCGAGQVHGTDIRMCVFRISIT